LKNSIVILLSACLLLPVSEIYFFFHLKEKQIKREVNAFIHNNIEEDDLIVLRFSEEETRTKLSWKHSCEFIFAGQMYDIIEQGRDGNTFWYKCYRDHKETRLNLEKKNLMARALGQDPFRKNQTENIKDYFKIVFGHNVNSWKPILPDYSSFHYSLFIIHYSLSLPSPPSPPPKCS
jgi:hypothetical protein